MNKVNSKNIIRLPMQYFAEGEPAEPQGGEPAGQEANHQPQTPEPTNYDELLKTDKELQSWLDRRVTASTQTAVQKAFEKARLLADEKASEAEKLAAMNEKERQAYELKKAQDKIAALENEKNARELKETALSMAKEQGVRTGVLELYPFEHLKAEDIPGIVEGIKAAYTADVQGIVAEALNGAGTPKAKGGVATSEPKTLADAITLSYEQKG